MPYISLVKKQLKKHTDFVGMLLLVMRHFKRKLCRDFAPILNDLQS